jgi:hypothetical protein
LFKIVIKYTYGLIRRPMSRVDIQGNLAKYYLPNSWVCFEER